MEPECLCAADQACGGWGRSKVEMSITALKTAPGKSNIQVGEGEVNRVLHIFN